MRIIVPIFLFISHISGAVIQTNLQNGLWELVGFAGNHQADTPVAYNEDITREIIDIADDNTTYLVKEDATTNGQLAYIRDDYTLSTSYISSTSNLRSSIGIFAIKNSLSPSGKTILKTDIDSAVKLKVDEAKLYNPNIPHYRMYLKGKSRPIVRIDYQANYEGSSFKIKFGNENEDYQVDFDNTNTFSNAINLKPTVINKLDLSAYSANIRDSIDFGAGFNDFTKMGSNEFNITDINGNYNQDLIDYGSSGDFDVTVYRFKDGQWGMFNSSNQASSNDFDSFDVGQGYWIKTDNARSASSANIEQVALISRDTLNADIDYSKIKNGWNMMSFPDTYIRYSPTGAFIPQSLIASATTNIRIYRVNRTGTDKHSIEIPNTLFQTTNEANSSSESSRYFNLNAKRQEVVNGYKTKIKSIPVIKVEDNGSRISGIMIISDEKFEISMDFNETYPISMAGVKLNERSINAPTSIYGEYLNFININDLSATDINASISLRIPKYSSSPLLVSDLNDVNKTLNARNILRAMNTLSTKAGETTPSTNNAVYLTTLEYNSLTDYNISNNHDTLLISSGARFSVADSTYTKIYKFNRNGKFKIISSSGSRDIDSGNSEDMNILLATINNVQSATGIVATSLGSNSDGDLQFMLSSTKKGIRLLENDAVNLFDDISLTSSSIANTTLAKGAISSAHTFNNVLNQDIVFNLKAIDGVVGFVNLIPASTNALTETTNAVIRNQLRTAELTANPKVSYLGDLNVTFPVAGDVLFIDVNQSLYVSGDLNISSNGGFIVEGTLVIGGDLNMFSVTLTNGLLVRDAKNIIIKGNVNVAKDIDWGNGPVTVGGTITSPVIINADNVKEYKIKPTNDTKEGTTYLDKNISGVPVGLFDLKSQPFPNITPDLGSNPFPSLDYPLSGGIIESFYEKGKKINSIMTLEYSSTNQGFWKMTDLTKDIDTLYGNSYDSNEEYNNDYQGIFHLYSNKSYWVNIGDVSSASRKLKDIKDALSLKDSEVTMQSYTKFSNTFNKGISITQNHINHRLNIKFDANKNFILDADYYNVVAIIKGIRYYLKRNGNYFSLDINDNTMPLKEKSINEKDEPIILEAYDGTGVALKESSNTAHFKIKYFKPSIPSFTWNMENDLILDDRNQRDVDNNISKLELYVQNVSDIASIRERFLLTENNISKNKDDFLKWNYDNNTSLYGGLTAIRAIIKKFDNTKKISFYSDIKAVLYAPLKRGHTLEANTTNRTSSLPYSYISNKKLTKNNGVQLTYISNPDIDNISMAYYPQGRTEGLKSLEGTAFGASQTMFLRVNSGATNQDAIASIKYLPEYINSIFYISFNNKLYQGRFANDDRYSNDGNAYNLEGEIISADTFSNGTASQANDSEGRVVKGGAGISMGSF